MSELAQHPDEMVWHRLRRFILDAVAAQDDMGVVVATLDAVDRGQVTFRVEGETMVVAVAGDDLCRVALELLGL